MKAQELRGRDPDELRSELRRLQQELFNLNFQWQAEESPKTSSRSALRRDIARCKTVLREIEVQQQPSEPH